MLPHYSPFKVAETFRLLAALAPGRIDLGLGRAPGTDGRTSFALQRDLADDLPEDHPFAPLGATLPDGNAGSPAVWLLGSSMDSALWAAEAGLPYCFADFINSDGADMADQYRRRFKPSAHLAKPYVMAAIWTIAADDAQTAQRLAAPAAMMLAHLIAGKLPRIDTALGWLAEHPEASRRRRRSVLGAPGEVRRQLDGVAQEYGADELMLVNILPDHVARRRSYELVAHEYGLVATAQAA